jgi:membrane associated rhomboid family serine protease
MIPLKDNIPSRTVPYVNFAMIGICAVVFVVQLMSEGGDLHPVERFGMIPARVLHPDQPVMVIERIEKPQGVQDEQRPAKPTPFPPWATLLTCIFLHGGWMHFLGNMWFLYIFGDNVEDRVGHVGYLLFYLGCGLAASATHLLTNPESTLPTIGASGAIAGVMGAYMLLYPKAMVLAVVPLFVILQIMVIPAPVFLGIWFLLQFFQGAMAITNTMATGVAWWAHIGGFAGGFLVAAVLRGVGETRPPVEQRLPHTDHPTVYRIRRD